MISLIVAVARNGIIGCDGKLPWRLPEDVAHFRRSTVGKTVLMGRRTYESIGHALEERDNLVASRDPTFRPADCEVVRDLSACLERWTEREEACVVMGGSALYAAALPLAERLYLTRVEASPPGDVRFPEFDGSRWRELECRRFAADERHAHAFSIAVLEPRLH